MVCNLAALVLGCTAATTTCCLPAFFCLLGFGRAYLANDGIGRIFAHHIWGMDHIKLGSRILASKRENCQLAPRVLRQEACDVEHPAVQDDPAVLLRCVLGHLFNSVSTTTCVLLFPSSCSEFANNCIGCIFAHHIWRVDHVKFCGCILASKCDDCKFASRVLGEETRHVQHPVVKHHPTVFLGCAFSNFLHGEATTTGCLGFFLFFFLFGHSRLFCRHNCLGFLLGSRAE